MPTMPAYGSNDLLPLLGSEMIERLGISKIKGIKNLACSQPRQSRRVDVLRSF
jgi:hypothetical protein